MKENRIKDLLIKSKPKTSHDFSNKLIDKLEIQQEKTRVWSFKMVFMIVTFMIVVLSFFLFRFFDLFVEPQKFNLKIPLFLIVSIVFILCINYLMRLNETHKYLLERANHFPSN